MTAQQLIEQLQRIVVEYGPDVIVEARNIAGDMNPLDEPNCVQVVVGWKGVTTVQIDPSAD